jgi:hypothetical protein
MNACHVIENHGRHHQLVGLVRLDQWLELGEHLFWFADRQARPVLRDARGRYSPLAGSTILRPTVWARSLRPSRRAAAGHDGDLPDLAVGAELALDGRLWCSAHQ